MASGCRLGYGYNCTNWGEAVPLQALSPCSLLIQLGIPEYSQGAGISLALHPCVPRQELLVCPGPAPQQAAEPGS